MLMQKRIKKITNMFITMNFKWITILKIVSNIENNPFVKFIIIYNKKEKNLDIIPNLVKNFSTMKKLLQNIKIQEMLKILLSIHPK